jgi:hypothetical protein
LGRPDGRGVRARGVNSWLPYRVPDPSSASPLPLIAIASANRARYRFRSILRSSPTVALFTARSDNAQQQRHHRSLDDRLV